MMNPPELIQLCLEAGYPGSFGLEHTRAAAAESSTGCRHFIVILPSCRTTRETKTMEFPASKKQGLEDGRGQAGRLRDQPEVGMPRQ